MDRVYLDNAATSWPKPVAVYDTIDQYLRHSGAPAGRGAYDQALEVARAIDDARQLVAKLIGADRASRIVFTSNGTDSLNLSIHGLLRAGDHVVTSQAEHNSVLRPLRAAELNLGIRVTRVPCDAAGRVQASAILEAICDETRLVIVTHASNVTGALQPIAEIGRGLSGHDCLFLVDAAQTLGQVPIAIKDLHADLLAAPGHKGLLGPLGTGILYVGPRAERQLICTRQGGTGSESESELQPEQMPERLEVGNLNVPGILGVAAGVRYLLDRGVESIRAHHTDLLNQLTAGVDRIAGVKMYAADESNKVGVLSISIPGYEPQEVAAMLGSGYGIQVRAGYHCAAAIHVGLGSDAFGGTVRFSVGPFNTREDIERAIHAVEEIAAAALPA